MQIMAREQQRVASWYWIVSAALLPFIMMAAIFAAYGFYKSKSSRYEAEQIVARLEEDHKRFEPLRNHIKEVAEVTGAFIKGDPDRFIGEFAASTKARPGIKEEDDKGADANVVYRRWRDAEVMYYGEGSADKPGMMQQYVSARKFLDLLNTNVERWVAYKTYQVYTLKTINIYSSSEAASTPAPADASGTPPAGTEPGATPPAQPAGRVVVAAGVIARKGSEREISPTEMPGKKAYLPADGEIDSAHARYKANEVPADRAMRPQRTITLEAVLRQQMLLIDELVAADLRQYGILVGEVTGDEGGVYVGRAAEIKRREDMKREVEAKSIDVKSRGNRAQGTIDGTKNADVELGNLSGELQRRFEDNFNILIGKITIEAQKFEAEKQMHEADKKAFVENLKKITKIKGQVTIKRADADGRITYSDDVRKSIHIDLGRMDGVKAGQRFEVWRYSGIDKDQMLGVIEIVRTLSDYTSLCTILALSDDAEPIRKGDAIVSRVWHAGKFLTVALHGDFEPPQQAYTKARLTELLKQAGVRVVEKVQPGTDLVITGSNLFGDEWYRNARNDLRFEILKEEEVRLYVDPR
jgi:hypothetical protein